MPLQMVIIMDGLRKLSDYEVIMLCLNEDQHAYTEIVSRYKNLVYSVVLKMLSNPEDANDMAQEIFIKVYKNLERYSPDYKFSTWIMRIATNHVIDYKRKKRSETVPLEEFETVLSASETPESEFIKNENSKILNGLVTNLPDIYKIPIVLFHQQGLSYQEISDIVQEPLSKVKNRIFRGRRMLKESLTQMEEGSSYGLL